MENEAVYTGPEYAATEPDPTPYAYQAQENQWAPTTNVDRGYAGIPTRTAGRGGALNRCNPDTHYFACKHEKQCDCGMTQRVPTPDAGL